MKTVLVLAQHPELAQVIPEALNPEEYRVLHRLSVEEAEPLIGAGAVDACIIDVEAAAVQGVWMIERVRRRAPNLPLLVYVGARPWDWEEEAYLQGVSFVVSKPVRPRMLNVLLERVLKRGSTASAALAPRLPAVPAVRQRGQEVVRHEPVGLVSSIQTLSALRDFSGILTHSLSAEGLLKQFLLLLREIVGVNRAAIFLRSPLAGLGDSQLERRRLRSACAIGLAPGLLEHFELSFESGIGGFLFRRGRILRREDVADPEMEKEFELLGAEVAIPVLDRETLVGIAAFDGRVTGEPLGNSELELIFHLLEELGLAVKNIWLHDQLAENHSMLTDILRELSSACVLVSRDLTILHANKTARSYFARSGKSARASGELEFSDLPMVLGSKVYQVLRTGTAIAPFRYQPPDEPHTIYQVTIMPFQKQDGGLPNSVLLVVEDQTQSEHLKRLEIEAANLRLVRTMADRLAHEVGNALVPLSTHQQLLGDKFRDPEFRVSLDHALADSVKRISRLINQMRFLAREGAVGREALPLNQLIEEAFQDAQKQQPGPAPSGRGSRLKQEATDQPVIVAGDRAALRHALSEVFLNAIQANPTDPRVAVRSLTDTDLAGSRWVHIDVQDNGAGFTAEALKKVPEPFYTTRNVGLGLGLTVSRKIIETHQGKLAILPPQEGRAGVVRISLPLGQNQQGSSAPAPAATPAPQGSGR
ncbi:MAG: ATP-binding protein [Verrucomicrobia subdivision 3 bacterium]|nr:ATP-binding protein [Limisphaerales bacterium]